MSAFSVPFLTLTLACEQREAVARIVAVRARRHRDAELRTNARAAAAALATGGETVVLPAAQATALLGAIYVALATSPNVGPQAEAIDAVRAQLEPLVLTPEQMRARLFA